MSRDEDTTLIPNHDCKRLLAFVKPYFGIEGIKGFPTLQAKRKLRGCSHKAYPVVAYRHASQKTVPYRGGIVGLVEHTMRTVGRRVPLASLTLTRLGFLMRIVSPVHALGSYRLIGNGDKI